MSKPRTFILLFVLWFALAACGGSAAPSPTPTIRPFPTLPPLPIISTPAPGSSPVATPVLILPTPPPTPTACAFATLNKAVFSDVLTNLSVEIGPDTDDLSFLFDPPSANRPQGPAHVAVSVIVPPFYKGQSSEALEVAGAQYLLVRFSGMKIEAYTGATDLALAAPALNEVALSDASEGVLAFIVGYDSLPCPTLNVTNTQIILHLPY